MLRFYAIGFAVMAALMLFAGVTLAVVTLATPAIDGTPESDWLVRAGIAIVLGLLAAILSSRAWRQARKPAA